MKLNDFFSVLNKSMATVDSVENPYGDYYVIKMTSDSKIKWTPGEHGIFKLPGKNIEGKKWRAFSLASTSDEGTIVIGTRTGDEISSFKKQLINMKPGEKISLRGPFGWFKIVDKHSPLVLIASGVGITPIRALLKQLENDTSRDIHIVYASKGFYLFGEEIKEIVERNPKMTIHNLNSRTETQDKINELGSKYKNDGLYYISGSMPMIKETKTLLKKLGVKGKNVINDPFFGY